MHYDQFLERLEVNLGLPSIPTDAAGACTLRFDDVLVSMTPERTADILTFTARVGSVDEADLVTQEHLLIANLLGDGTGGATLSMDVDGAVRLSRRVAVRQLDYDDIATILTSFVNHAEFWQTVLQAGQTMLQPYAPDAAFEAIRA